MRNMLDVSHIAAAVVYSGLGVAVFTAWFCAFDKLTPYDLWDEIVVKQNRALAQVISGVSIGICLIIAAAVLG